MREREEPVTAFGLLILLMTKKVFSFKPVHVDVIWVTYLECTGALF